MKNPQNLALILQHATYEKLHLAGTLAATTAAMGGKVHIFLSHEALLTFVQDQWDEAPPCFNNADLNKKYMDLLEDGKAPKPTQLFKRAQELENVKFYGCSESASIFRFGKDDTQKLDAVIGYTTFLDIASDAKILVI